MQTLRFLHELLGTYPDRRRAPRFFADLEVIVEVAGDKHRIGAATVMDCSAMGLRLRHSLELTTSEHVIVTTPFRSWDGCVVWTLESEGRFIAGIAIPQGDRSDKCESDSAS